MASLTSIVQRAVHEPITLAVYDAIKDALETGWVGVTGAAAYASADAPTFTMTIAGDYSTLISAGCRVKLTQAAAVKYFLVTGIAVAGGVTTLTLYGGTDYVLANAAVSSVYYSPHKAPVGFPLDPTKWTVEYVSTSAASQPNPTAGVWYNVKSLTVPIGAWYVSYEAMVYAANRGVASTLATASNAQGDSDLTCAHHDQGASEFETMHTRGPKMKVFASKTTLYLNLTTADAGITSISVPVANQGATVATVIRAVCAYL